MGTGISYLLQINKNYYFRIRIPRHLKVKCNATQIKKSLRTGNLQIALKRVKIARQLVLLLFKQMERNIMSDEQFKEILDKTIVVEDSQDDEAQNVLLNSKPNANQHFQEFLRRGKSNEDSEEELPINIFTMTEDVCKVLSSQDVQILLSGAPLPAGEYSSEKLMSQLSEIRQTTTDESVKSEIDKLSAKIDKFIESKDKPDKTPLVKDLIDEYVNEKSNDGTWKIKTKADCNSVLNLFSEIHGEKQIGQITRPMMVEYRDKILKNLPKNRNKGIRAKMSLEELLADTTMEKISDKRISNSMVVISGFFSWCIDPRKLITINHASGLKIKDRRHSSQRRDIYTDKELERIVTGLSQLKSTPAMKIRHVEWTWISLIGMYQGIRENEICQLGINNIVLIQGVPCFSITEEELELSVSGQSIKNLSSMRTVPVHKELLRFGFLNYVNQRRTNMNRILHSRVASAEEKERQKQLFPSMTYLASGDTFTKNFYNFYSKFNKNKVILTSKATFHSLRHNFATALNNSSEVGYAVSYLCGHSFKTETDKTYTKPLFDSLYEELARLKFNFDLFEIFNKAPVSDERITELIKELPSQEFYHFGKSD